MLAQRAVLQPCRHLRAAGQSASLCLPARPQYSAPFSRRCLCKASEDSKQPGTALQQQQQSFPGSLSSQDDGSPFEVDRSAIENFLRPPPEELPEDIEMPIWDHLEELRERVLVAALAAAVAIAGCFCFSKELVLFLEAPVADAGVRFLQLSPGEFFFTTFKVAGYSGLLLAAPTVLYEIIAYVVPGLTKAERKFLAPIVFGSSILFYIGLVFSYEILTPAALNFFVSYAEGAVESLWSIDQYFQFVLVLMLSTGLSFQFVLVLMLSTGLSFQVRLEPITVPRSLRHCGWVSAFGFVAFPSIALVKLCILVAWRVVLMLSYGLCLQVPVIQVLLGQLGIVNSEQMFSLWRYVVVGSTVVAAVLTPSTDPFTQALLAIPLVGLYMGGAAVVRFIEQSKLKTQGA